MTKSLDVITIGRAGVDLYGGWYSGNLLVSSVEQEKALVAGQVGQFAALGAPCVVYGECSNTVQGAIGVPVSRRPKLGREEITTYAKKLTELAKWSMDQGVPISFHHHMGSVIEDAENIDWLMEGSGPELTLLYDTGHLHFTGADVMGVLHKWAHRVHHVHFKDGRQPVLDRLRAADGSFLDAVTAGAFTVPGDPEGCIDFQAVIDKLKAMDYSGWIVVDAEQDPAKAPPYDYSKMGYEHIVTLCERAGLAIESRG